jgi:hypothetical protein
MITFLHKIYTYKLLKYLLKLQHILTTPTQSNIYQMLPSFLFAHDHIFAHVHIIENNHDQIY